MRGLRLFLMLVLLQPGCTLVVSELTGRPDAGAADGGATPVKADDLGQGDLPGAGEGDLAGGAGDGGDLGGPGDGAMPGDLGAMD